MKIISRDIVIPNSKIQNPTELFRYYAKEIKKEFPSHVPIRFVVTSIDEEKSRCEIDLIECDSQDQSAEFSNGSIFDFTKRTYEDSSEFVAVLMIPTGIGAEIGGHCGDGNVAARLLASTCDVLITHPNVVNASDINEMTENTLYVEGSILTRFLMGSIGLQPTRSNRVLLLMDKSGDRYFNNEVVNAVSSARVTLGVDCDVLEIENPAESEPGFTVSGRAAGSVKYAERLFDVIRSHGDEYDAIGLSTIVDLSNDHDRDYFMTTEEVVNPWGGIEAMITHSVAEIFKKPCAHSPLSGSLGKKHVDMGLGVVDPRKAPETASITYLHCILKGLHRSPRITCREKGINVDKVSCLVVPDGCVGLPVLACMENGIPVIAVKNKNRMKNDLRRLPFRDGKLFFAENYVEAAGIMSAIKAGVSLDSLRRPINKTKVL
ncbi:MAG: DUF3326 domain-containing protein [Candidatus Moranbacteria bacterium]|nr:DUF3326 domain-containing protein [Candidatus Moranbacteria bacterium]